MAPEVDLRRPSAAQYNTRLFRARTSPGRARPSAVIGAGAGHAPAVAGFKRDVGGVVPPAARPLESGKMRTFSAKPQDVRHDWFVVDASDKVLGRLAAEIARRLRGKHKPEYTPHVDTGDFIVVVNAGKLKVTGAKGTDKMYYRHSTYPGGVYETSFDKMQGRFPGRALQIAVKGMLPKGPLGYAMIKKLKIYAGGEHPHTAQQPKPLEI
jgi:large subunit ribosomal protein L13